MVTNLYVEISGRRTGKSQRLFKAAIEWSQYGDVVIICPNRRMADRYDNLNFSTYRGVNPIDIFYPNKLYTFGNYSAYLFHLEHAKVKMNNPRIFYDEFCFISDLPAAINTTGYYVSTPNKIYYENEFMISTDILPRLIHHCKANSIEVIQHKSNLNFKDTSLETQLKEQQGKFVYTPTDVYSFKMNSWGTFNQIKTHLQNTIDQLDQNPGIPEINTKSGGMGSYCEWNLKHEQ